MKKPQSDVADVAAKDLRLDEVARDEVHVLDADLHEGLRPLPGEAQQVALEAPNLNSRSCLECFRVLGSVCLLVSFVD